MISEDLYNKICNLFLLEGVRLENRIVDCHNYIIKYRPSDPVPYINLIKAQAENDYFNKYIYSLLQWLDMFVDSEG